LQKSYIELVSFFVKKKITFSYDYSSNQIISNENKNVNEYSQNFDNNKKYGSENYNTNKNKENSSTAKKGKILIHRIMISFLINFII